MPNLAQLNAMERVQFTQAVGPVFEHSSWIAERAWEERPFASPRDLHQKLCAIVRGSSPNEQLELIRAHPDLVTRAPLTRASQDEQASAGLSDLSAEEAKKFQAHNAKYRSRFGFPFVICAGLNKKEAILRAFPERLQNSHEQEIQTALAEIFKIAELRLRDLIRR